MDLHTALHSLVGLLPFAAFIVRQEDRVSAWNDAAASLLGLPAEAAVGRAFRDLRASYGVPGLRAAIEAVKTGGDGRRIENVAVPGDHGEARVTFVAAPLPLPHGDRAVLVVAHGDNDARRIAADLAVATEDLRRTVREREEAYEELRVANEELSTANEHLNERLRELEDAQEASRHKDDFLAMLAHELRNPLAPVVSATQVIRLRPDDRDGVQRAREIIERQVRHQARLLDDLLDVSRVARGKVALHPAPTTLGDVVAAALEETRTRIDARRHTLAVSLPDAPIALVGDPVRLAQAIANVVDNAAKYTPPGGRVDVTGAREGDQAVVRVRDTGVGIPADMLGRVFDLFTQVEAPLARSQGGLGVGLTLARTLVELHGGTLEAASEGHGRGSEFTVRLPVSEVDAPVRAPGTPVARSGRRIVVIEDNADAREMLRIALELDGHEVEAAADGPSGIDAALDARPDVVLVDIGLPGVDGYEVARRLRAALGRSVRLVALTGYGQAEDRRRTRDAGFDVHLVKPVDPGMLGPLLAGDGSRAA